MTLKISVLGLACVLAWPVALATAQTTPAPPSPTDTEKVIPEKAPPTKPDAAQGDSNSLSDKLKKSNGVIAPPTDIDPDIRKPTPPGGASPMPVIPPPGTPGGGTGVQPK